MISFSESIKEFVTPVNNILFYYGIPIAFFIVVLVLICFGIYKIYDKSYIKKHSQKSTYKDIMGDCDADIIVKALRECKRQTNNKH